MTRILLDFVVVGNEAHSAVVQCGRWLYNVVITSVVESARGIGRSSSIDNRITVDTPQSCNWSKILTNVQSLEAFLDHFHPWVSHQYKLPRSSTYCCCWWWWS
jgi:hypothetical protein